MRSVVAVAAVFGAIVCCPAVAHAAPVCADFGGVVENEMCTVHVSKPSYALDLKFPVDFVDQQALTDYVTQTRDGFINVAEDPDAWNRPYQLELTSARYASHAPQGGTSSVVTTIYQYVGGAHPSTWYKSFTYDRGAGRAVTFDTLFAPGADAIGAIAPLVQRNFAEQTGDPTVLHPGAARDPSHYQNFAITDDELILFIGQGEMAAEAVGAREVHLPRSALPPLAL